MLLKIYPDTEMTLEAFLAVLCGCAAEFLTRVLWEATGRVHSIKCLCCGCQQCCQGMWGAGWIPRGLFHKDNPCVDVLPVFRVVSWQ